MKQLREIIDTLTGIASWLYRRPTNYNFLVLIRIKTPKTDSYG